ncbi:MAG: hypothetical protein ACLTDR_15340 [Adlercreutzia equolifaciens]
MELTGSACATARASASARCSARFCRLGDGHRRSPRSRVRLCASHRAEELAGPGD